MLFKARLDDLRPNRQRSAAFADQVGQLEARRVEEVEGIIAQVEEAAAGGLWAVGYIGYEAAPAFDRNLQVRPRGSYHRDLPLVWFGLYATRTINPGFDADLGSYQLGAWEWVDERSHFEADVARIRELIAAGDTYQTNYTSRLRTRFSGDALALYKDLAEAQSGGYGTFLDTGRFRIASASPELFFDRYPLCDGVDQLITRPMKGTIRRGRWSTEDEYRRGQLAESEKDRAENLIIVDLLRNDLGRVAEFGTVGVDALMALERYDTVWQMTSTISAEVEATLSLGEVLGGLFPCGSITGAPKVRTMEIIAELESEPRGVYTGAIGFVSPPGVSGPRASFSVGIRTVVIDTHTGEAEYGVGGGITFGSDPSAEYKEAALKAKILTYGRPNYQLLETMRWSPAGGWYWIEEHLDRLLEAAGYFGVTVDREDVRRRLDAAVDGPSELRVRLTVDRTGAIVVAVQPLADLESPGVAVAVDSVAVDRSSPFLFHKTTRRELYEAARARHPRAEDVLLVNEIGEITESTVANVAVKLDDGWYTPPIESGCLPGVFRRVLLEQGEIEERAITISDLRRCEGLALLNSVRMWRAAFLVDE